MGIRLLIAFGAALAAPATAAAHVLVAPRALEPGALATIAVTVANEHSSRLLEVVVDTGATRLQRPANLDPGEQTTVSFTLTAPAQGEVAVRVEQRFADGSDEKQTVRLPVEEPDPPMHLERAAIAGAAGLMALALALAVLARRRSKLPES